MAWPLLQRLRQLHDVTPRSYILQKSKNSFLQVITINQKGPNWCEFSGGKNRRRTTGVLTLGLRLQFVLTFTPFLRLLWCLCQNNKIFHVSEFTPIALILSTCDEAEKAVHNNMQKSAKKVWAFQRFRLIRVCCFQHVIGFGYGYNRQKSQ